METMRRDYLAGLFEFFADVWSEADRIAAEELSETERDAAEAAAPDDLHDAVMALAPLLARNTNREVRQAIVAILSSAAHTLDAGDAAGEVRAPADASDVTPSAADLVERVERLEAALRVAGGALVTGGGGDL